MHRHLRHGLDRIAHPALADDVAQRFPQLKVDRTRQCVRDGAFYTATGLTAGIELSQMLVEEDYGPQIAQSSKREMAMHVAPPRPREIPSATPHFSNQSEDHFAELIAWMLRNLDEDLSVETLARKTCMCPTIFSRNFKSIFGTSPGSFVQNLRLNEARRRLSTKRKTLHAIARSVGFDDSKSFRNAFERRFGVKPVAPTLAEAQT